MKEEKKEESILELQDVLKDYREQKKKVEKIMSRIGGKKGGKRTRIIDGALLILLVLIFLLDLAHHIFGIALTPGLLTLEVGVLLISVKVIWIAHKRTQTEHFMFWFLSSLETRVNLLLDEIRELSDKISDSDKNE